ncbi:MAG: DNA polymerase III subunit delta, partial [Lachnospiraceae bacterium]|nr:DNA polymerase III subunit delta [Lachnospiraceae bacterium]
MKMIEKDIETGKFQNVYLLYGEESYLKRQYKEKLLHALIEKGDTMNFSSYSGKEINPNELIDLAQTMPFFAERRVILVEDSLFFKNTCEELVSYLQELPEQTCFLFVESVVDKRSKMYKQVKKVGRITCFDRQKDDVLMRWVGSRLKKEGKTMTKVAYQQFITKTGDDME